MHAYPIPTLEVFMNTGHILILGGARSGKSLLGEKITASLGQNPAYIATAQNGDNEMGERIAEHQRRRGAAFTTYEESIDLSGALVRAAKTHDSILVDCLTLWLSNIGFYRGVDQNEAIAAFKETLQTLHNSQVILISNEVGQGIVPDNALARKFRDDAGRLHQELGQICTHVYMVIAGLPMVLKGEKPELD